MIENFNIPLSQIPQLEISPLERSRMLFEKGVTSMNDLVRLSGAPCSVFLAMDIRKSKSIDTGSIPSVKVGHNEVHFYEMVGGLIENRDIENVSFVESSDDFVKSLLYSCGLGDFEIQKKPTGKGISIIKSFEGLNRNTDLVILKPSIGGYISASKKHKLEELSVRQLNLLFKGVVQYNPENILLEMIIEMLKNKIR